MDHNTAFGIAFKRLRQLRGMTQEDFASVVSERYVRMLEKGEYSPTITVVIELAQVLGVSPLTLMGVMQAERLREDVEVVVSNAVEEVKALKRL